MPGFRPRFFVAAVPAAGDVMLDDEDSHHVLRVLRLRPGDECEVVAGAAVYAATVLAPTASAEAGQVRLRLGRPLEGPEAGAGYRYVVALVQALIRPSALDWSIEKSTEAGASLIALVLAAGSPRPAGKDSGARRERWARIAREAAKQSKQPAVPGVETEPSFATTFERLRVLGLRSIVLDPLAGRTLYDLVASQPPAPGAAGGSETGVALWVGPESGWTEDERERLLQAGAVSARLGRGVLRAETAGPVAVAVARLALGDW